MRVIGFIVLVGFSLGFLPRAFADVESPPRCEVVPLAGHEASFRIDGIEITRWHFGPEYPRPFFYPFNGPSGTSLTRMGHPGAPNHDHHRSIWFAHHDLEGNDFWSDETETKIRQKRWIAYVDGDDEAIMASLLGWYDDEGKEVMEQELVVALSPVAEGGSLMELQSTFGPAKGRSQIRLGKTNFGFLAVRVSKSISKHFGGGEILDSEGRVGESAIFGRQSRWMDYSGRVAAGTSSARHWVSEGITYFDHPRNLRYPSYWHVREDGWMGASFDLAKDHVIKADQPLVLRYMLYAHDGAYDSIRAGEMASEFADRSGFLVRKSSRSHHQFEVQRVGVE